MRVEADGMNDMDAWSRFENGQQSKGVLHESIFSDGNVDLSFSGKGVAQGRFFNDDRMETVFLRSTNSHTIASKTETNFEVRGTVSWGGKDGPKGDVTASGSVRNTDNNTYVEVDYTLDSDGKSELSAAGGKDSGNSNESVDNTGQDQR